MAIALNTDFEKFSSWAEAVENAEETDEKPEALVVNVHANYVIPEDQRYKDIVFPHMSQAMAQFEMAEQFGSVRRVPVKDIFRDQPRPFRRPDFADEWQVLKKAWSLHTRGRDKLSLKEMDAASKKYYFDDPLKSLPDWVWRFCLFLGATKYEGILREMLSEIKTIFKKEKIDPLLAFMEQGSDTRAKKYFEIMRDYFAAWNEFSQVHHAVAKGMLVPNGHIVTTSGFSSVKMFYGNAFEVFASVVDILAFLNNLLENRSWDQFKTTTSEVYLRSDKARRFDTFADRAAFARLCEERDNQLRNASHHSELNFDVEVGLVSFKSGKGGSGDLIQMSYAEYLSRASTIFFQIITLLRFEIFICQATGRRFPV